MKNNPLDDIVTCNVEISQPASEATNYENTLLVVAPPEGEGDTEMNGVITITKPDDLLDYGYTNISDAYMAASVAFAQSPAPSFLYVTARTVTSEEEAPVTYETIDLTLDRAEGEVDFYGIHLTGFKEATDVKAAADWAEAHDKLFGFEYTDIDSCPLSTFEYYRTFAVFSGKADGYTEEEQPESNAYTALAILAKCSCYVPGSETWHLKELADIVPSKLTAEDKEALAKNNINTFLRYAGKNVTFGGAVLAGEWIDVIRFRDWLVKEMQKNVFNAMQANTKIPFTDAGIGLIEGKMNETLKLGQDNGGICETEYDDNDNAIPGYTITVPKASALTELERKNRKLTGCRYTARLTGAIHAVEISGYLTF